MNKIIVLAITALITTAAQAGFVGSVELNSDQKKNAGFAIQKLSEKVKESFVNGRELRFVYGRSKGSFQMELVAQVLLPHANTPGVKEPKMKVGLVGLNLNSKHSADIYNQLAIDYTPKKIKESIEIGHSKVSCSSPTKCQLFDNRGNFDIFRGEPLYFGESKNPFYADINHGRNKYRPINHSGATTTASGALTPAFVKAIEEMVYAMAPSRVAFQNVEQSRPNRELSYDEHRELAYQELENEFGETALENDLVMSLLTQVKTSDKELVRKPRGGNCTYFCPASGPFVRAMMSAETNF